MNCNKSYVQFYRMLNRTLSLSRIMTVMRQTFGTENNGQIYFSVTIVLCSSIAYFSK